MNLRRLASSLAVLLCLLSTAAAAAAPVPPDTYSDLRWRLVGPLRGGWGTAASGVPGQPETFYFGAADGGVWKTTDAGRTWNPLFDHEKAASVGALVVAPSDPAVLYVGTGQVTTRWDIASGNGVYRSGDGGKTWEHRGLADSRHIGRLWVDPRNADVVLAAAQGHFFGPNAERGVFRSTDGGKNWDEGPLRGRQHRAPSTSPPIRPRPTRSTPPSGRCATTPGSPTSPPTSDRGAESTSRPTAARPGTGSPRASPPAPWGAPASPWPPAAGARASTPPSNPARTPASTARTTAAAPGSG